MNKWINPDKEMPKFRVNQVGIWVSKAVVLHTEEKTVHVGYAVKSEEYLAIDNEVSWVIRWYDLHGDRVENVDGWISLPTEFE